MRLNATSLSPEQKADLEQRYRGRSSTEELAYGTVKDFCDSSDHVPYLCQLHGDLKDLQRPAALKSILGLLPAGSSLLEIGAGEPVVAHLLSQLGYRVTVVDPYDGSGNGPTEFERYVSGYSDIHIIRNLFSEDIQNVQPASIDCIYSISVLEHIHGPALAKVFRAIKHFLKPGGYSLHLVDHVLAGQAEDFFLGQLADILLRQARLAFQSPAQATVDTVKLLERIAKNVDVYYLSAEGHNRWRGTMAYESFPYRRVVSVSSCKQLK